ncbi:serine acetyltransferase [Aeromicrobium sp. Root495]|uniref:serine acetyltransferase n=1 Tax=Aeromicrobium sp. Root495 TaxID=1736550 RepID=UPI0009E9153B|nr:hypothetical protein [Aeromicrobium sp. Root495]
MSSPFPTHISNWSDYRTFLRLDLEAHGLDRWRWHLRFYKHEVRFQRALRRAEFARSLGLVGRPLYVLARLALARESLRTGISISPGSFGPGLSVAHHGSVVVNGDVRAGAFCRIHSSTNLGAYEGAVPRLGDFVYIGPGVAVFGNVTIGEGVAIGANSVVVRDVPRGMTAVGAPAVARPGGSRRVMPKGVVSRMPANLSDEGPTSTTTEVAFDMPDRIPGVGLRTDEGR